MTQPDPRPQATSAIGPFACLAGKRGLVVGIANDHSIAAGYAVAFAGPAPRSAATCSTPRPGP